MPDARRTREFDEVYKTLAASVSPGEVWAGADGAAEIYPLTSAAASSGARRTFEKRGEFIFTKSTGFAMLPGGRAYWDVSANAVNYMPVNDGDFYLGRVVDDAASGDATVVVNVGYDPPYKVDLFRTPFNSTLHAGTPAAGGYGYPVRLGDRYVLELTATSQAQCIDLISVDGFDLSRNPIVEAVFCIMNDGSNATQDFTIGVASGTHASDFQSVTSFVAASTVGNSTNINLQSDDNSTDVAPTDTTYDYVEGSAVANRVEVWFDFRDPADVQCYVNGVLALGSTTFTAGASGTHFLIAHLEKTSGTDVYKVGVDRLCARTMEQ